MVFDWIQRRRARRLDGISFCESCGQVCDRRCRAGARRRADRDLGLRVGVL